MPSQQAKTSSAEIRFRQALERLISGKTNVLPPGSPVSQNNVAREASCDPSALKKSRFPALVCEIQAYVELHQNSHERAARNAEKQKRAVNRSTREHLADAIRQRDMAQSLLASANQRIVELSAEVQLLQRRLDELNPPPVSLMHRTKSR